MVASSRSTRIGWAHAAWPGNCWRVTGSDVHVEPPSPRRTARRGAGRSGSATTRRSITSPEPLASSGASGTMPASRLFVVQSNEYCAMAPSSPKVVASGAPKKALTGDQCISRGYRLKPQGGSVSPSTSTDAPMTDAQACAVPLQRRPGAGAQGRAVAAEGVGAHPAVGHARRDDHAAAVEHVHRGLRALQERVHRRPDVGAGHPALLGGRQPARGRGAAVRITGTEPVVEAGRLGDPRRPLGVEEVVVRPDHQDAAAQRGVVGRRGLRGVDEALALQVVHVAVAAGQEDRRRRVARGLPREVDRGDEDLAEDREGIGRGRVSMTAALTPSPPRLWPTSTTRLRSTVPNQSVLVGVMSQSAIRPRW